MDPTLVTFRNVAAVDSDQDTINSYIDPTLIDDEETWKKTKTEDIHSNNLYDINATVSATTSHELVSKSLALIPQSEVAVIRKAAEEHLTEILENYAQNMDPQSLHDAERFAAASDPLTQRVDDLNALTDMMNYHKNVYQAGQPEIDSYQNGFNAHPDSAPYNSSQLENPSYFHKSNFSNDPDHAELLDLGQFNDDSGIMVSYTEGQENHELMHPPDITQRFTGNDNTDYSRIVDVADDPNLNQAPRTVLGPRNANEQNVMKQRKPANNSRGGDNKNLLSLAKEAVRKIPMSLADIDLEAAANSGFKRPATKKAKKQAAKKDALAKTTGSRVAKQSKIPKAKTTKVKKADVNDEAAGSGDKKEKKRHSGYNAHNAPAAHCPKADDDNPPSAKKLQFKCLWAGCARVFTDGKSIKGHINDVHIPRKAYRRGERECGNGYACHWQQCVFSTKAARRYHLQSHILSHLGAAATRQLCVCGHIGKRMVDISKRHLPKCEVAQAMDIYAVGELRNLFGSDWPMEEGEEEDGEEGDESAMTESNTSMVGTPATDFSMESLMQSHVDAHNRHISDTVELAEFAAGLVKNDTAEGGMFLDELMDEMIDESRVDEMIEQLSQAENHQMLVESN